MRAVVQRVNRACVRVEDEVVGSIGPGLLVLVGVTHTDTEREARTLARKMYELRIFEDERSASQIGAEVLVVSQFTLYGNTRKGRRPSWIDAAPGEQAEPLVDAVVSALREFGAPVATGRFGAHMAVDSENDGPVTVLLEVDAPGS